jgi:hypothetical protein
MGTILEISPDLLAQAYAGEENLFPLPGSHMGEFFGALAKARGEFKPVAKNCTANVVKNGVHLYSFQYADLAAIGEATDQALSKFGIVPYTVARPSKDGGFLVRASLGHESGARMESRLYIPSASIVQEFGKYLTYLRRYCLSSMLSVAADGDADDYRDEGEGAPQGAQAGKPGAPTQTFTVGGFPKLPTLDKAEDLVSLNKAWLAIADENKPKFKEHYEARMSTFAPKAAPAPTETRAPVAAEDAGGF